MHGQEQNNQKASRPDLSKLRKVLFWDTNIEKIDWDKYKRAVINRVFERGNESEKNEIIRFYGKETVDSLLNISRKQSQG